MKLLFRVDANPTIGCGHMMRCLSLAQACQDHGIACAFALGWDDAGVLEPVRRAGLSIVRVPMASPTDDTAYETCKAARDTGSDWVVADGYQLGAAFQHRIKAAGLHLLFIDDCGRSAPYEADLVLNQNGGATEEAYRIRAAHVGLLLGSGYVLLRREFARWRGWRHPVGELGTGILVTFGGSDPARLTGLVSRALSQLPVPGLRITAVIGPANPCREELELLASQAGVRVEVIVDPPDMASLMASVDMAVAAAGSTAWELAFMGVPSVLAAVAENQAGVVSALERAGAAVSPGSYGDAVKDEFAAGLGHAVLALAADPGRRSRMSASGQDLIDGLGARRVLEAMERVC